MKQAVDERIARGICHLFARAFWLMLAVQAVVLVGKLALGAGLRLCAVCCSGCSNSSFRHSVSPLA